MVESIEEALKRLRLERSGGKGLPKAGDWYITNGAMGQPKEVVQATKDFPTGNYSTAILVELLRPARQ